MCKVNFLSLFLNGRNVSKYFLNLFDNECVYFISDKEGKILYSYDNLNNEKNISESFIDSNIYSHCSFDINNFCFQKTSLNSNLEVYCLPYFVNDDKINNLYFWLDCSRLDFSNRELHFYLNNMVLKSDFLNLDYIIAITNKSGQITTVNDMFCKISQYSHEELIGKTHRIINSGYHSKDIFKDMWNKILYKEIWHGSICNKAKDSSLYWTNTTIIPKYNDEFQINGFISIRRDITKVRKKSLMLEDTNLFKNLSNLNNSIFKLNLDVNGSCVVEFLDGKIAMKYNLVGKSIGKRLEDILPLDFYEKFIHYVNKSLNMRIDIEFEIYSNRSSFLVNLNPVFIDDVFVHLIGSILDISNLKEKEISSLLLYNSNTESEFVKSNLNNIVSLDDLNNIFSNYCSYSNNSCCLLYLSLDRLKYIIDVFGLDVCEELIFEVSKRLIHYLNEEDSIYRLNSDDFIIFISDINKYMDFENYIEGIINCFYDNYILPKNNLELSINCNLGGSVYPLNGETLDVLVNSANTAMHLSKDNGKNNYIFYDKHIHKSFERRVLIENELRNGLSKNEFSINLQAKVECKSNFLYGAEALLRWNNNNLGFVSPGEFIPIAEETGLINEIGSWILKECIKKLYEWNTLNKFNKSISVNVSVNQLLNHRFLYDLDKYLNKYPIDTQYLDIEITESTMLDFSQVKPILDKIKSKGILISIDDFGTGYSSLTYLSKLPVDFLKIDQSFVRDLNLNNQAIIKTIINLAHNMGIQTIAEGVESKEHVNFLFSEKCDYLQGYYFSKPIDITSFEKEFLSYVYNNIET